jgi:two-component system chemotaxis response regulator CheY
VVEAGDGDQAVKLYQEARPDAVLLDVTMPRMDGLTALKEIRKIDPRARVAMVTAMGQQDVVVEALKSGARDFVMKPFEAERLNAALDRILS